MRNRTGLARDGFTLIEVMVALAITLLAMDVLFGGIVSSLNGARKTAALERAVSRAESHLAALGDSDLTVGERSGEDGGGYRWSSKVAFIGAVPAPNAARKGPWARGTGLYTVSVTITWNEGRAAHRFVLDSARLGTVPGPSP